MTETHYGGWGLRSWLAAPRQEAKGAEMRELRLAKKRRVQERRRGRSEKGMTLELKGR